MKKREVADTRREKPAQRNKKVCIPFLSGRPRREKVINNDDITNLSITLNTCHTCFEELLRQL